ARLQPALPHALGDLERARARAGVEALDVLDLDAPAPNRHAGVAEPPPELDAPRVGADDHVAALRAAHGHRARPGLDLDRAVVVHGGGSGTRDRAVPAPR